MPKRIIIDIVPPEKKGKNKEEKQAKKQRKSARIKLTQSKPLSVLFAASAACLLIFLVWFVSGFYSELTLGIKPKIEIRTFEDEAEINVNQDYFEIQNKIIPGKFVGDVQEKSRIFSAEGKDVLEEKARGTIRVYNSYNPPRTITLRENTRFLSSEDGKVFRCLEKIYLPAAQLKDGKIIPSFKDVAVAAQEGGESYDIGPSKFSVPGLAGSALYYSVWAESTSSMSGGFKKEIIVVGKEDLEKAKNSLKEELLKTTRDSLKNNLSREFVLGDDAVFIKNFEFSCSEKEGDKVSQFSCQAKMELKGLIFKISELEEIVMRKIKNEISAEKDFDPNLLAISFLSKNLLSDSGKMILAVEAKINQYDRISREAIAFQIKGKPKKQINEIISADYPQIESLKCRFKPFWTRKAPNDIERIKIEILPRD